MFKNMSLLFSFSIDFFINCVKIKKVIDLKEERISKIFKFKFDNVRLNAVIEKPVTMPKSAKTDLKDLHYHIMYEFFPIYDESVIIHTEKSTTEYKNCFVCIPPFCRHRTIKNSGFRILFSYDKTGTNPKKFQKFMDLFFSKNEPFEIPATKTLVHLQKELDNTLDFANSLSAEAATAILKLMFYNIYKLNVSNENDTYMANESYLVKIDDTINDFQKDITLQSLADALHLSTRQTSRILQKNYKKKLSEILIEKRLSVAAELLLRSDKTIHEIVEYVNFPSERYFYTQFKKAFGCTPRKYRILNIN